MNTNVAVCAAVIAAAAAVVASLNGHENRESPSEEISVRSDKWPKIRDDPRRDGWYRQNLRCGRYVFLQIVENVQVSWTKVHPALHHNTVFGIADRVACCIHYLTHNTGYETIGEIFGISKTRCYNYCLQVMQVLTECHLSDTVALPKTPSEWSRIEEGFERLAGMPNVYGAIDGSLIPIKRLADFDGWYCRKGFTAFNMQGTVSTVRYFSNFIYKLWLIINCDSGRILCAVDAKMINRCSTCPDLAIPYID